VLSPKGFKFHLFALAVLLAVFPLINGISIAFHRADIHSKIERQWEELSGEIVRLEKKDYPNADKCVEFDFKGHRYDVISVADKGSYWLITVIDDTKEKWLEEQDEKNHGQSGKTAYWIKTIATENVFELKIPTTYAIVANSYNCYITVNPFVPVFSPPPEV
jgi:hypothetical protein